MEMEPQVDIGAAGALVGGVMLLVAFLGLAMFLGISAVICYLISNCFKAIPQEHRKMEPGMVWLLMIPCFSLVWNFFVWPKLAQSYKAYFDSVGNTEVGDCGYNLNMALCIACACILLAFVPIPCVGQLLGTLAGLAALALFIICFMKAYDLKGKITSGG